MKKVLSVVTLALLFAVAASARTQSNNIVPAGNDSGKAEGDKGAKVSGNSKLNGAQPDDDGVLMKVLENPVRSLCDVGFYIPAQKRNRKAQIEAMHAAAKELDGMIASWGATEDELMDEYTKIRRVARDKKDAK